MRTDKNISKEVLEEIARNKTALMIFHENIDLCKKTLGCSPAVAKILYALADFDKSPDKEKFEKPNFDDDCEHSREAEIMFGVMLNSAKVLWSNYVNSAYGRIKGGESTRLRWEEARKAAGKWE